MKRRSVRMSKASRGSSGSALQEKKGDSRPVPTEGESRGKEAYTAVELEEAWTTTEEEQ